MSSRNCMWCGSLASSILGTVWRYGVYALSSEPTWLCREPPSGLLRSQMGCLRLPSNLHTPPGKGRAMCFVSFIFFSVIVVAIQNHQDRNLLVVLGSLSPAKNPPEQRDPRDSTPQTRIKWNARLWSLLICLVL
eukprot:TRINITY_DN1452_c0_g1_i10.p1 TRINITY_DN1452_c0_g1~~TRINITY_DN1452_c0_g1_i10.p1  ORF type:complete len:134 (+),score=0.44 TRINITY_DN1452_c0_g1_i10:663-1064(+)